MAADLKRDELEEKWRDVYQSKLPALAREKNPAQKMWPVQLDHCFARIILDAVVGRGEVNRLGTKATASKAALDRTPWTAKLKSPAIKHMDDTALASCISLGEAIMSGEADLVQLDEESLKYRGKSSKTGRASQKRKSEALGGQTGLKTRRTKQARPNTDIRIAFGANVAPSAAAADIPIELSNRIREADISDFRKRVLSGLCQVPKGSVSSYLALAEHLDSSARAVGNALRHNPFAPQAPCHRIIAADHSIGGFGGSWGTQGVHFKEKVDLLKAEGVEVDAQGKVKGEIWSNFKKCDILGEGTVSKNGK